MRKRRGLLKNPLLLKLRMRMIRRTIKKVETRKMRKNLLRKALQKLVGKQANPLGKKTKKLVMEKEVIAKLLETSRIMKNLMYQRR